jgi:hypothetical protein
MIFQRFKEYLNDKGDLQKKPIVDPDADTGPSGKSSPRPPKAVTKGKNWKNMEAAQINDGGDGTKPAPYMAPGTDPGMETADGDKGKADPLGQKGDRSLVYKPKTEDQTLKMKKLHNTTPEKTKTEEFLNITKGLSPERYAEYILRKTDAKSVKQVIETVEIINKNELLVETFVREMKRKGDFVKLVEAVLAQPETYGEIATALASPSKGKNVAHQLAKAVNEITAPAANDIENPRKAKTVKGIPTEADNIMISKKLRPEHNLIEALANYGSIKMAMRKLVN